MMTKYTDISVSHRVWSVFPKHIVFWLCVLCWTVIHFFLLMKFCLGMSEIHSVQQVFCLLLRSYCFSADCVLRFELQSWWHIEVLFFFLNRKGYCKAWSQRNRAASYCRWSPTRCDTGWRRWCGDYLQQSTQDCQHILHKYCLWSLCKEQIPCSTYQYNQK